MKHRSLTKSLVKRSRRRTISKAAVVRRAKRMLQVAEERGVLWDLEMLRRQLVGAELEYTRLLVARAPRQHTARAKRHIGDAVSRIAGVYLELAQTVDG
jgi:hypothetical protein